MNRVKSLIRKLDSQILIFLSFALVLFNSCSVSELEPAEYIEWVDSEENGLIKTQKQGDVTLSCQYTPNEYTLLKQKDPGTINKNEFDTELEGLDGLIQFKFKFERENQSNFLRGLYTTEEDFNRESMYLSFDIRNDLHLVSGDDTLECAMCHHERTYGNTPFETLLLTFAEQTNENDDLELIFDDRVFNLGRTKFFYSKEILESVPELILE